MLNEIKKNWFFIGLFFIILIAIRFPIIGITIKPYIKTLIIIGMFLIGLRIDLSSLIISFKNFKAITFCMINLFVAMPILSFILGNIFFKNQPLMYIGIILAGAVATTQASSIIWTDMSNGNPNLALVLMVLSNSAGIFFLPFILLFFLGATIKLPVMDMFMTLSLIIILPVIIAQIIKKIIKFDYSKTVNASRITNLFIVWMIVLTALSNSNINSKILILVIIVVIIQYLFIAFFSYHGSKLLGLNKKDSIAVMFCSSQKTITVATVIGFSYFEPSTIIYILVYHIFQQIMGQISAKIL